ncbi:MAG: O-antigen ligase family protein [Candidatus Omnitrophica bacterium]|nr:O-antigen ligase family protein [Candidatus Omnitrophota bacterium]
MLIFLLLIFLRPFICGLAFPELNLVYSAALLIFLTAYAVYIIPRRLFTADLTALEVPCVVFWSVLLISTIFSRNFSASFAELYKYISALGLFFIGASLSEKYKASVIRTVIFTGLVISLIAIHQYFFGFNHVFEYLKENKLSFPFAFEYIERKRVFLPFVTPGVLGGYLAMIIPLTLLGKNRLWVTPLLCIALLFTKSPVAFFSLFCGGVVYFCLQGRFGRKGLVILAGISLLIIAIFIWRSGAPKEYVRPAFSVVMRLSYWQESLNLIRAHPLVGVGPGNFNLQLSRYAHNSYLQILAEMGIFGLLSLIWIILRVFKFSFINLKKPIYRDRLTILLASSTVFLIHNFLDFTFFLPEVSFIWWLLLGMLII